MCPVAACSEALTLVDAGSTSWGFAKWLLGNWELAVLLSLFAVPLNLLLIEQQFTTTH